MYIGTSFELVTSKRGSPEETLVPMTLTASSMIRLRRRKRSQLQRRTVTPPSFQCVAREGSSCKLPHLFFDVVMQSKPMPEVKVRQFGKGRQDLDTDDQLSADIFELKTFLSSGHFWAQVIFELKTFLSSRLTWEMRLPFQGRKVSPFSTAVLNHQWLTINYKRISICARALYLDCTVHCAVVCVQGPQGEWL